MYNKKSMHFIAIVKKEKLIIRHILDMNLEMLVSNNGDHLGEMLLINR